MLPTKLNSVGCKNIFVLCVYVYTIIYNAFIYIYIIKIKERGYQLEGREPGKFSRYIASEKLECGKRGPI